MDFLALGVKTVQFCTIATKYGYGIVRDLESGTAFLMQERGIHSMKELIGIAQPSRRAASPDACSSLSMASRNFSTIAMTWLRSSLENRAAA